MTAKNPLIPVYITDEDDDGKPLGGVIAALGEWIHPVRIASHLVVVRKDGKPIQGFANQAGETP